MTMTEVPSLIDHEAYDGEFELSRESTISVFQVLKCGQKLSHDQIEQRLRMNLGKKFQVNTVNKAIGALRNAGYQIPKEHVRAASGNYYRYWMLTTADVAPKMYTPTPPTPPEPVKPQPADPVPQELPWDAMTFDQKIASLEKNIDEQKEIAAHYPEGHGQKQKIMDGIAELKHDLELLKKIVHGHGKK
jgi:biotin operon repressor